MSLLVDTNVLLRRAQPGHPSHEFAVRAVAHLFALGEQLCVTPQVVSEFWNVATRPLASNGLGLSVEFVADAIGELEQELYLLEETKTIYTEWKRLVVTHRVLGSKVHDAKLVAAMNVHGVKRILTFNTGDFARFEIEAVHPESILR